MALNGKGFVRMAGITGWAALAVCGCTRGRPGVRRRRSEG